MFHRWFSLTMKAAATLAVLAFVIHWGASRWTVPPAEVVRVAVASVTRGEIAEQITALGRLLPGSQIEINSSEPIRLSKLFVKRGMVVAKGQPLAELASADAIEDARALLVSAQMEEQQAQKGVETAADLFSVKAISPKQLAEAEIRLTRTKLNRASAERVLTVVADQLGLSSKEVLEGRPLVVSSPINGLITQLNPHREVSGERDKPLFVIADHYRPLMVADVNPVDLEKVRLGQSVLFTLPFGHVTLQGTITEIAPEVNTSEGMMGMGVAGGQDAPPVRVTSRVIGPLPKRGVAFGMVGEVTIEVTKRKDILLLPMDAVLSRKGERWAMVLEPALTKAAGEGEAKASGPIRETGKARRRVVTLGISDDQSIEVVAGLKENDLVIVRGQALLADGQQVRIETSNAME